MSSDPSDLLTLSPGHFLTGQQIVSPYEALLADIPMNRLSAWQRIQKLQQDFWQRWSQEYVNEQQRRNKWAKVTRSLKVGDLVFVKDELTPPCEWLMARIIETYEGADGNVRTCRIQTAKTDVRAGQMHTVKSTFVRPITQLCLLPMEDETDSSSDFGFPDVSP